MKLTLEKLHLENFKNTTDQTIVLAPGRTDIYGDNATGKTTVFDAITWLLFGKDSHNQTMFNIKPLAADGSVRDHALVTSVAATINVDGVQTELMKTYREKWTKKRGSAQAVFSGHETRSYIDGIPKTATAFNAFVNGLVRDETTFRMVTSPDYFPAVIDWKKRREILMEMCGDVSDEDVLAANPDFDEMRSLILKHGVDDVLSKLKADRTRVNRELDIIPVRIDEAERSRRSTSGLDEAAERALLKSLNAQIESLQSEMASAQAGGQDPRIADLKAQIASARLTSEQQRSEVMRAYTEAQREAASRRMALQRTLNDAGQAKGRAEVTLEAVIENVKQLRADYRAAAAERWHGETVCPTCGQPIPAEQLEEKKKTFNLKRSQRLEDIIARGKAAAARQQTCEEALAEAEAKYAQLEEQLRAIAEPEAPALEAGDSAEITALQSELNRLEAEAAAGRSAAGSALTGRRAELEALGFKRQQVERNLADIEANAATAARIAELAAQQKNLSRGLEDLDRQINLCERFIRGKIAMIEGRINGMFHLVHFKLYEEQVNGGIAECCTVQVNGVDYADLNGAARINSGLDVINTLSEYYDISAPVVVDNAEAVTHLLPLRGQLIRLVVSEPDKTLRVEEVA